MKTEHFERIWDLPTRVSHWLLVAAFITAYVSGDSERWRLLHVGSGALIAGILVFRLVWGVIGSRYARFSSTPFGPRQSLRYLIDELRGRARRYLGHNPAGAWAIFAMLLLGLGSVASGALLWWEIGPEQLEEVHEFLVNSWLLVVFLHIAGVIWSSLLHRESLPAAMLHGRKRAQPGEGIASLRWDGLLLLGLAVAGSLVLFLRAG
jgi:cytochrome b